MTHIEAAAECISTKPRTKFIVPWEAIAIWENEITGKKHPYLIKETQQIPICINLRKPRKN